MATRTPAPQLMAIPSEQIPLASISQGALAMRAHMDPAALQDLALSLSQLGQVHPVYVIRTSTGYELVTGHRRCAAAEMLQWDSIDARVVDRDQPYLWAMAWAENSERADVAITDQARWLAEMRERNSWTISQMAGILGKSPSHLSEILATLEYAQPLLEAVEACAIVYGVARVLNRITDPAVQIYYLEQAAVYGATVRTVEEWVRNWQMSLLSQDTAATQLHADAGTHQPPPQLVTVCAACASPSLLGMRMIAVCPSCCDLITNPRT